jgi:hypothetical protein
MSRKPRLGFFDIAAVVAVGALAVGPFLPQATFTFCVEWGCFYRTYSPPGQVMAFLKVFLPSLAVAVAVLTFVRLRTGAMALLAVACPLTLVVFALYMQEQYSPNVGAYLALAGAVGGIVFLAIARARDKPADG